MRSLAALALLALVAVPVASAASEPVPVASDDATCLPVFVMYWIAPQCPVGCTVSAGQYPGFTGWFLVCGIGS